MKTIMVDLLNCFRDKATPKSFYEFQKRFGNFEFNLIVIKILSWLSYRARSGKDVPLELNLEYDWCRNIHHIVCNNKDLSEIFTIKDNAVHFSPDIEKCEISEICKYVENNYKPRTMV